MEQQRRRSLSESAPSWWSDVRTMARSLAQQARGAAVDVFYQLYQRRLEEELSTWRIPKHIGIIMDGNRRFARMIGASHVVEGHSRGADKLDEVLQWCEEAGVDVITVWGFSLENFQRHAEEVGGLMDLIARKFLELVTDERIHRNQIQVRSLGRIELLPQNVRDAIAEAERATAHYQRRVLNVGVAYGGREEILDAFRAYLDGAQAAGQSIRDARDALNAEAISDHLYTRHVPDPDLIIRTSGEVRLSGFMLWQSVYSEFYFCDIHWPAFRKIDFLRALRSYHHRQRRFGI